MKARDIMRNDCDTLLTTSTYEEAARLLRDKRISGAPVLDLQGTLVGFISERDLLKVLYPYYKSYYEHPEDYVDYEKREQKVHEIRSNPISRYMTTPAVTVTPDTPLMKVGALMLSKTITRIPVVEGSTIVGSLVRSDILVKIIEEQLGFSE